MKHQKTVIQTSRPQSITLRIWGVPGRPGRPGDSFVLRTLAERLVLGRSWASWDASVLGRGDVSQDAASRARAERPQDKRAPGRQKRPRTHPPDLR